LFYMRESNLIAFTVIVKSAKRGAQVLPRSCV
jgi:hypothetical protein